MAETSRTNSAESAPPVFSKPAAPCSHAGQDPTRRDELCARPGGLRISTDAAPSWNYVAERGAELVGAPLNSGLAVPHPHGGAGIQAVAHVFEKAGAIG